MNWDFQLANRAIRAFRRMPEQDKLRINRALIEMRGDPMTGDTIPLKGEYEGSYRRRVGSWRIVFELHPATSVIVIHDIVRRSSTTY